MKKIILPLLLIISISAFSQAPDLPLKDGKIIYTEVVSIEGRNQDELYASAREWIAKAFNSANNVIQMEDKDNGKIVGKALNSVTHRGLGLEHPSGEIHYTISIASKDGRYKYEITDFYHTGNGTGVPDYGNCESFIEPERRIYRKAFHHYLTQLDDNTKLLIASLKQSMESDKVESVTEDW